MRIVAISDTHNYHHRIEVPDGDLLIHAGDATIQGSVKEIAAFAQWFSSLPHKHKIFVAGNHDFLFERSRDVARSFFTDDVICLEDSAAEIESIRIYGSPWTPEYHGWAFGYSRGEQAKRKWLSIPDEIDILITHGPPYGIRDERPDGLAIGCRDLRARVDIVRPKLHFFGHLHHGHGVSTLNGTMFANAAICNEAYQPLNKPLVVEFAKENG